MDWDDIVFENRNKEYGAYPIRKGYKKRYAWSLIIAISLLLIIVLMLDHKTKDYLPVPPKSVRTVNIHIKEYQIPKPSVSVKSKPIDPKQKETLKAKSTKVDNVPIVSNTTVQNNRLVIKSLETDNKAIESVEGPDIDVKPAIKPETKNKEIVPISPIDDLIEKQASTKVQSLPHYPGGDSAWYQYLRKNLNMQMVLRNGAMPAVYTAVVAFIVHPDSTISDFKIVKDAGYGTGNEALRVVQRSGKWSPGTKNGKAVSFAQLQTIIFKVNN